MADGANLDLFKNYLITIEKNIRVASDGDGEHKADGKLDAEEISEFFTSRVVDKDGKASVSWEEFDAWWSANTDPESGNTAIYDYLFGYTDEEGNFHAGVADEYGIEDSDYDGTNRDEAKVMMFESMNSFVNALDENGNLVETDEDLDGIDDADDVEDADDVDGAEGADGVEDTDDADGASAEPVSSGNEAEAEEKKGTEGFSYENYEAAVQKATADILDEVLGIDSSSSSDEADGADKTDGADKADGADKPDGADKADEDDSEEEQPERISASPSTTPFEMPENASQDNNFGALAANSGIVGADLKYQEFDVEDMTEKVVNRSAAHAADKIDHVDYTDSTGTLRRKDTYGYTQQKEKSEIYDENGKLVRTEVYYKGKLDHIDVYEADGKTTKERYVFDGEGNATQLLCYEGQSDQPAVKYENTFSNGNLIESTKTKNGTTTVEYYSHGTLERTEKLDTDKTVKSVINYDKDGTPSSARKKVTVDGKTYYEEFDSKGKSTGKFYTSASATDPIEVKTPESDAESEEDKE